MGVHKNPAPSPRIRGLGVKKGNFSTGNAKNKKRETEVSRGSVKFALPMYNQLTLAQRYTIFSMRQNNSSLQVIADELNRIEREAASEKGAAPPQRRINVSTISRELRRNRTKTGKYNPRTAHEMAMERRERIVRNTALKPGVLKKAIRLLKDKRWSPEQISGHLRKKGIRISKERIYQHIRRHPELAEYCHHKMKYRRHQKKQYRAAGKSLIPDRVSIHDRPKEADGKRFGDWEMDLVIGKEQKSQVLTLFERSKSYFMQTKLESKKPKAVADAVIRLLRPFKDFVHTITTDNGVEFMDHKRICKALDCIVYFADPYCSGQKGGVENINKIFREFFPKGTDFRFIEQKELDKVQYQINERPRKKLDFSTPKFEFYKMII